MLVLHCADLDHEEAEWEVVYGNGGEDSEAENLYMQLDSATCHLVTEKLGSYVLVANLTDLNAIGGTNKETMFTAPRVSMAASSSGCSSLGSPQGGAHKLTPSTKSALSRILDVPSVEGNGWRDLAEALGAQQYESFLATQASPSEALLDLWEARTKDMEPLKFLSISLKRIRREDAHVILERDL